MFDASSQAVTRDQEPVWPVLTRQEPPAVPLQLVQKEVAPVTPFRAAQAAPDVPGAVGASLFAAYLALVGALALATAASGVSSFVLAIAGLFVVAFFAVPRFIMAQEPKAGSPLSIDRFLADGMETFTGHCSGRAALVQMFVVPVLLTLGILLIGLIIAIG